MSEPAAGKGAAGLYCRDDYLWMVRQSDWAAIDPLQSLEPDSSMSAEWWNWSSGAVLKVTAGQLQLMVRLFRARLHGRC